MVILTAFKVLPKVVPPLSVMVTAFKGLPLEPTAPVTPIVPVLFKVRFAVWTVPDSATEAIVIGVAAPAPTVKVSVSVIVVAPKVIWPVEVPPITDDTVDPVTLTAPKLMTPVPEAVTVPCTVVVLAVLVKPPVKL